MKSAIITADELRSEIESLALNKTYPKGFTAREFADASGVSHYTGQRRLAELVRNKLSKHVGERPITRMDGKSGYVPVYQICKK